MGQVYYTNAWANTMPSEPMPLDGKRRPYIPDGCSEQGRVRDGARAEMPRRVSPWGLVLLGAIVVGAVLWGLVLRLLMVG
jgi:hypothetical protein